MSRRKQGSKPQHRSELSREDEKTDEGQGPQSAMLPRPAVASQDLLTCGQCGRSFLLRHILDFIEHKKSDCDRPARLRGAPGGPHSPLATRQLAHGTLLAGHEDARAVGVSDVSGEGAPTGDEMEPACYICNSCKEPFPSAWLLLQHSQYSHGLHIFLELDHAESPPPPSNAENPPSSTSPLPQEGSPFEDPRASETAFRVRSPAGALLFAPPLHCPPDQSDSGSEETGPSPASGRALPDFSRRLRTLAGGPGPSRRNHHHQHRLPAFPPGHQVPGSAGSSRQRSPHGRSKDCEFCGKTFKFPSNLVVHRRSHTGEKPYRCPFCEHACSQSSKLKRHMKTHAGLFNGWPPAAGTLSGRASKDQATHRRRYVDERGGQQDPGVTSPLGGQEEFGLKIKMLKVEPNSGEDPRPGEPTERSDSEGNGPTSDSELANGEAERPGASPPPPGLANGFGFHAKRLLGPPPGPGLLRAPLKAVKAEPGLPLEEAGSNFYSRWLADCAASRQPSAPPPLPPPPPAASSSSSPSPAPRASPASENSGENNAGSCPSTPPQDASADSGTASGHSTPKRAAGNGGREGEGRWEGRRRNACEFCGKVFRNASNLTVHRRSHTGERPYRCELCPYACTQSSKLTRHMKTHIQPGKEVFRCHTCNVPFSIYSTLEKHIKKRHSEQLQEPQLFN
ncbi:zinc finger protein 296 [Pristis pectinata]|uniref:zinc finger protein 296 n=1 Tax=Pristis pectinata TaxID=685728 RepID=UPI00223E1FC1|nr:zinc finger protein 296 [Pristis pectinata]